MDMDRPLHIPYNENSMVVDMDRSLHMPSNSKPHLSSAASENFRSACLYWGLFWAGVSTLYAEKDILMLRILKHFTMSLSSALYIVKRLGLGMGMGNRNRNREYTKSQEMTV